MPYEVVEDGGAEKGYFRIEFDGRPITWFEGSRAKAEAYVHELQRKAEDARRGLSSSDPPGLCRLGWHRRTDEDETPLFFKLLPRLWGAPFGFRVGPIPSDDDGWKVAVFGGHAVPWFCEACKEEIGAEITAK